MMSACPPKAAIGKPPLMILPRVVKSGRILYILYSACAPPKETWREMISSKINRIPHRVVRLRRA